MARSRKNRSRSNTVPAEVLEDRKLLTGNVTAQLVGGQLSIQTDAGYGADEDVDLVSVGDNLQVRGLAGTTITVVDEDGNAQPPVANASFSLDDINRLYVRLGRGNDAVSLRRGSQARLVISDIEFDLGAAGGDDRDRVIVYDIITTHLEIDTMGTTDDRDVIDLLNVRITEQLEVRTGNDRDVVNIENSRMGNADIETGGINNDGQDMDDVSLIDSIFGDIDLVMGVDNDRVNIEGIEARDVTIDTDNRSDSRLTGSDAITIRGARIEDRLLMVTGSERETTEVDSVSLSDVTVEGGVILRTGGGWDQVQASQLTTGSSVYVVLGDGGSEVEMTGLDIGERLDIGGDRGDDDITILDSDIRHALLLRTGEDEDSVLLDRVFQNTLLIEAGDSDDEVVLRRVYAYLASVDGEDGRDSLTLDNVYFRRGGDRDFETVN